MIDNEGGDNVDEFYDADDQKYLNIQKLDRLRIIFIQMLKCSQIASVDNRGKGRYVKQVIGRAIPIIQDIWLDEPHVSYYYAVRQLYVLVYPEFKKSEEYVQRYNKVFLDTDKDNPYDYKRTEKLHKLLVSFIEERFGRENGIIDIV